MDDSKKFFYIRWVNDDGKTEWLEDGDGLATWYEFAAPAYVQAALLNVKLDTNALVSSFTLAQAVELFAPRPGGIIPLISQRDPAWRHKRLGMPGAPPQKPRSTIGNFGCVVTPLSMMLTAWSNIPLNPVTVNDQLVKVHGFTGKGENLVIWEKVEEAFPEYCRYEGFKVWEKKPADTVLIDKAVAGGAAVLIKVDMSFSRSGVQPHYLLIVGGTAETGYMVHDPWLRPDDQVPIRVPGAYARPGWDAARAIYAAAFFTQTELLNPVVA